jgi:hypothetical protein
MANGWVSNVDITDPFKTSNGHLSALGGNLAHKYDGE